MLALLRALGMARSTIYVEDVKIAISSSTVVETLKHHIQNAPRRPSGADVNETAHRTKTRTTQKRRQI